MIDVIARILRLLLLIALSVIIICGITFGCFYTISYFLFPNGSGGDFMRLDRQVSAVFFGVICTAFSLIGGILIPVLVTFIYFSKDENGLSAFGICGLTNSLVAFLFLLGAISNTQAKDNEFLKVVFFIIIYGLIQFFIGGMVGFVIYKLNSFLARLYPIFKNLLKVEILNFTSVEISSLRVFKHRFFNMKWKNSAAKLVK